jgi:cyclopropane-fatty-acyl-phospholipid synthase
MSVVARIIGTAERVRLPDVVIRAAIYRLCARTAARFSAGNAGSDEAFAQAMAARAIAEHPDVANAQHYEVPAEFFALVLGPNRKYSSCFYKEPTSTLREAEEEALRQTVEHADLADGQSILELGCGWGSLSLWMARLLPNANIVAMSNSQSQRKYIEREIVARRLGNLRVVTSDINAFDPGAKFDRIVSAEMLEHLMNWRELMARLRGWLTPDGRFFLHIFTHRAGSYLFDRHDPEDWIAQHFFTGGVMPSHHLIRHYADLFTVEKEWRWHALSAHRAAMGGEFRRQPRRHRGGAAPGLSPRYRAVDAALALVLPRHRRPVRLWRRRGMGRQPLPDDGELSAIRPPASNAAAVETAPAAPWDGAARSQLRWAVIR